MYYFTSFIFAIVSCVAFRIDAMHPQQSRCHCYPVAFDTFHKPFEKIYVSPCQVLSMPQGTYLKLPCGKFEKIHSLSEDYRGTFVLKIYSQCTHCGRVYDGTSAPEGWSCFEDPTI